MFSFNYLEEVEIQLHDSYFLAPPLYFALLFWIVLTFLIFLIRGFRNKFLNLFSTWILLASNTFLIAIVLVVAYVVFVFFNTDALMDLFRASKRIDTISDQFNKGMMTCAILHSGRVTWTIQMQAK